MPFNVDRPFRRSLGSVFGAAFLAVGAAAMADADRWAADAGGDRVFWYGATACLIGLIAVVGSWMVEDPDTIWCRHPRHPVKEAEKPVTGPADST